MLRKRVRVVFSPLTVLFALFAASAVRAEEKGSFSLLVGAANAEGKFSGASGTNFAFGFRLGLNPFHEKENFLNRLGLEPSFLFVPVYSQIGTVEGALLEFKERLYQPGVDLSIKALDTEKFDVVAYGGTAFSFDRLTIPGRYYTSFYTAYSACDVLPRGTCRTDFGLLGRGGARFLYFPKEDSGFHIGADLNSRRQFLFVIGTTF
jgi:hypothetical protein